MTKISSIQNVLVVDDDPLALKLLSGVLSHQGYKVQTAHEAAVGLQMAMNQPVDLVILDVMMPIINGFNFCHLLKSQKAQQHILVILVTSRDQLEDVKIGLQMGADAYLTKPLNTEELLKTIKFVETLNQNRKSDD